MTEQKSIKQRTLPSFTPSQFMKGRRPHLYSDSVTSTQRVLTREVLSYHLETLTNQKDETKFETFAVRLCEKFISPNLRPQTGPTGGGDGKTDAETYPVAKEIAQRWLVSDSSSAQERWAFAFSAKKDWRAKINSDVASIVSTNRKYPHIYFVTNQFVPAKDSASVQDTLSKKHKVPITILDRTWILDRVFNDDSVDIAVEVLGVGQGTEHDVKTLGPSDYERAAELEKLEREIGDGSKYNGTVGQLAEDSQRAALLARGLERPRFEVEGRYHRAIRIAREHKLAKQELAAIYNWAWTSYFWYDDPITLNNLYDDVERLALGTDSADEIERLTNLIPLLRMSVLTGTLSKESAKLDTRTTKLVTALERIISDTSRPNNALHARSLLLLVRVSERATANPQDSLVDIWIEFKSVLDDAEGLGTFPFGSFADVLTEMGTYVPESEAFDQLYDAMTNAVAKRVSEGEAAKKNCERGYQKLTKDLPYEAIRLFGKAISLLVKEEYEDELVKALIGASFAYENSGLLWAARNHALAAVSQQFSAFSRTGTIDAVNPAVLERYFWLEFRIGRIPYILKAHEMDVMFREARATTDELREALNRTKFDHDGMLGAILLRSTPATLSQIGKLPDALERMELGAARMALLFVMGHEDTLRSEGSIPESETPETVTTYFEKWFAEGSKIDWQSGPDFLLGEVAVLRSSVLGCELQIECASNVTSIAIGEAVLGTIEAILATSLNHQMMPHLDRLRFIIAPLEGSPLTPKLTFAEKGGETIGTINHAAKLVYSTREETLSFQIWLKEAILEIVLKFVTPSDVKAWGKAVFEEENAFSRALTFSNIPIMISNIFGEQERLSVSNWFEAGDEEYAVKPMQVWDGNGQKKDEDLTDKVTFGEGEPPEDFFNFERRKHSDLRVVSPINVEKWNEAKWIATFFMFVPGDEAVAPILGLAFKNREPAIAIFEGWRTRFGVDDPKNDLRIAIIRGISAKSPLSYAVSVGPNLLNVAKESPAKLELLISRINRMYPTTSKHLEGFLDAYQKQNRFYLVPAHMPNEHSQPDPLMKNGLGKYQLIVREAWEIGEHDPDSNVLDVNDPPIIPKDQPNAPVLKALERMAKMKAKRAKH